MCERELIVPCCISSPEHARRLALREQHVAGASPLLRSLALLGSLHSQPQHQQLNNLLNSLVTPSRRVSYRRVREIDYAYRNRVRVTRDSDTLAIRQPHGIIRKNRLADMNIYCPNQGFDFRISINTETDVGASCRAG